MPEDTWNIVKEFMLDWKKSHQLKLKKCLDIKFIKYGDVHPVKKGFWKYRPTQGIICQYPKKCINWEWDNKSKCVKSYWRIPWKHDYETRVESPDEYDMAVFIDNNGGDEWGVGDPDAPISNIW